jgi:hypothetical protein
VGAEAALELEPLFAYLIVAKLREGEARHGYRLGQVGSASLVSLAHGTNDAQKTMGIITLALIAHGNLDADHFTVPLWVKVSCGVAIAAGTFVGGWRIIDTMGNRLTEIEAPQGFAAESSGASVILARRTSAIRCRRATPSRAPWSARGWASAWRGYAGAPPVRWPARGC